MLLQSHNDVKAANDVQDRFL